MIGFLPVDKPGGITSHDVVDRVRRATGIRKVGHAGTLDPMATGLVVCGIGPATRLMRYIQDLPKTYVAEARFGIGTGTLDADGEVVHTDDIPIGASELEAAIPSFVGEIMQTPPMVSAVKIGGERLYEKARRGEEVERAPRPVTVHRFEVLSFSAGSGAVGSFEIECGKGTYVRTLVDALATTLGTRAHLTALRRTAIGLITVSDAVEGDIDDWERHLLRPADGLRHLERATVGEDSGVANGRPVPVSSEIGDDEAVAIVDENDTLMAVYRTTGDGMARPEVVIPR